MFQPLMNIFREPFIYYKNIELICYIVFLTAAHTNKGLLLTLVLTLLINSYDNFKGYQAQTNRDDIVTY